MSWQRIGVSPLLSFLLACLFSFLLCTHQKSERATRCVCRSGHSPPLEKHKTAAACSGVAPSPISLSCDVFKQSPNLPPTFPRKYTLPLLSLSMDTNASKQKKKSKRQKQSWFIHTPENVRALKFKLRLHAVLLFFSFFFLLSFCHLSPISFPSMKSSFLSFSLVIMYALGFCLFSVSISNHYQRPLLRSCPSALSSSPSSIVPTPFCGGD